MLLCFPVSSKVPASYVNILGGTSTSSSSQSHMAATFTKTDRRLSAILSIFSVIKKKLYGAMSSRRHVIFVLFLHANYPVACY